MFNGYSCQLRQSNGPHLQLCWCQSRCVVLQWPRRGTMPQNPLQVVAVADAVIVHRVGVGTTVEAVMVVIEKAQQMVLERVKASPHHRPQFQ